MSDYMEFDCTPVNEECAQVGDANYWEKTQDEYKRTKALILKKLGGPPPGAYIKLKGFCHDFGTYHQICVFYDDMDDEAIDYAFAVERYFPVTWDDDAPVNWKEPKKTNGILATMVEANPERYEEVPCQT